MYTDKLKLSLKRLFSRLSETLVVYSEDVTFVKDTDDEISKEGMTLSQNSFPNILKIIFFWHSDLIYINESFS